MQKIIEQLVLFFHHLISKNSVSQLVVNSLKLLHSIFLESHISLNSNSHKCSHAFFLVSLTRLWHLLKKTQQHAELIDLISDLLCFILADPDKYLEQISILRE
jgi:hypothetical protein